jgi:hypothetical protein
MSFQSLNPELTAKVVFLANLQRNLVSFYYKNTSKLIRIVQMQNQNQNATNEKTAETNNITPTIIEQQQFVHPLLMPSLVCNTTSYFSQ